MRKFISGLLIGIIISTVSIGFSASSIKQAYYNSDIKIRINGKYINTTPITVIDEGQQYGKNFTAVRDIAESMGGTVYFDPKIKTIDIISEQSVSKLSSKSIEEIAENAVSTVLINIYKNFNAEYNTADIVGTGSGVIIMDGMIVTNYHVLAGERLGIVFNNIEEGQEERTSTYIHGDKERDIAIIAVNSHQPKTATIGSSNNLKIGQKVVAISSPKGLKNTVSEGIISGFRTINGQKFIQTTAAISPGSSGGGLYDMNGSLIGITSLKNIDGESLNFAIPIDEVMSIVASDSSKLNMTLFGYFRNLFYNGQNYFFNYYGYLDENMYTVWFNLKEDWEGASVFINTFETDSKFRDTVLEKVIMAESMLRISGYKNLKILVASKDKTIAFEVKNNKKLDIVLTDFDTR